MTRAMIGKTSACFQEGSMVTSPKQPNLLLACACAIYYIAFSSGNAPLKFQVAFALRPLSVSGAAQTILLTDLAHQFTNPTGFSPLCLPCSTHACRSWWC